MVGSILAALSDGSAVPQMGNEPRKRKLGPFSTKNWLHLKAERKMERAHSLQKTAALLQGDYRSSLRGKEVLLRIIGIVELGPLDLTREAGSGSRTTGAEAVFARISFFDFFLVDACLFVLIEGVRALSGEVFAVELGVGSSVVGVGVSASVSVVSFLCIPRWDNGVTSQVNGKLRGNHDELPLQLLMRRPSA